MGHRRKAREYALQALYMYETVERPVTQLVRLDWVEKEIPDELRDFCIRLITGSIEKIDFIDDLIRQHSKNWKFERITAVDKSILRISIYALIFVTDVPEVVTIDEAVELGKIYGGESSGQFLNGILDAIRKSRGITE